MYGLDGSSGSGFEVPFSGVSSVCYFDCLNYSPTLVKGYTSCKVPVDFFSPAKRFLTGVRNGAGKGVFLEGTRFSLFSSPPRLLPRGAITTGVSGAEFLVGHSVESGPRVSSSKSLDGYVECLSGKVAATCSADSVSMLVNVSNGYTGSCFDVFSHLVLTRGSDFFLASHAGGAPLSPMGTVLSFLCAVVADSCASTLSDINLSDYCNFCRTLHSNEDDLSYSLISSAEYVTSHVMLALVGLGVVGSGSFSGRSDKTIFLGGSKGGGMLAT